MPYEFEDVSKEVSKGTLDVKKNLDEMISDLGGSIYLQHSSDQNGDYVNMNISSVPIDSTPMEFVFEGDYMSMDWHRIIYMNTNPTTGTVSATLTTSIKKIIQ